MLAMVFSCSEPAIRKPVVKNSGISYFEESIKLTQTILKQEEAIFKNIMQKDTTHNYIASPYGFWYFYDKKNDQNTQSVKSKSLVIINYEIKDTENNILISEHELGSKNQKDKADRLLKIDGENFILGLHEGIKLMKEGEIITFLLPSNKAFGVTGLSNRIAPNQPLIITVKLKKIIN